MNRILMNNNIIVEIGNATVDDNKIVLKDGENYYLEFVNCTDISIEIVANDASLNIISLDNNFSVFLFGKINSSSRTNRHISSTF